MAYISDLDKVEIASDILDRLLEMNIDNTASVDIEIDLTAGETTKTEVVDNSWSITATQNSVT